MFLRVSTFPQQNKNKRQKTLQILKQMTDNRMTHNKNRVEQRVQYNTRKINSTKSVALFVYAPHIESVVVANTKLVK